MSQAPKFYTDAHIATSVATQLRKQGIDIVRCQEVGLTKVDDETHLAFAAEQERTIITLDEDFLRIHGEWQTIGKAHAGILYIPSEYQGDRAIGSIVKEVLFWYEAIVEGAATLEEDLYNQVIFVK
ncbi:MAG: DUF5615 family PIN-like protein [Chloroflexi bacterium]|nr:DUF5615 family PIN-like protein [Chloroflexota bacterium]